MAFQGTWRVIVNPAAAVGRAGRRWPSVADLLSSRGIPFAPVFTTCPGRTAELAESSVRDGFDGLGGDVAQRRPLEHQMGAAHVGLGQIEHVVH